MRTAVLRYVLLPLPAALLPAACHGGAGPSQPGGSSPVAAGAGDAAGKD